MRLYFCMVFIVILPSCVPTKKYRKLESDFNIVKSELQLSKNQTAECGIRTRELEQKVMTIMHDNKIKDISIESCKNENRHKDTRLKDMEEHLNFAKSSSEELTKRIEGLSASNKVNVDIMKKLLEEQEVQQLKVLNLSLALQKQDSLNIHLVKKSKRNISDEKLKRTLEKLGFVFF